MKPSDSAPISKHRSTQNAIQLADQARDRRDWRKAADQYSKALTSDPRLPHIWVQLGHALKEQGDWREGEEAYRSALALDDTNADTHLQLGHVLKLQGKLNAAAESYFAALCRDNTADDCYNELQHLGYNRDVIVAAIPSGILPASSANEILVKTPLNIADLDRAAHVFLTEGVMSGSHWDEFRGRAIELPDWFDHSLNPYSAEYLRQQDRLWSIIAGRTDQYRPEEHEQTPEIKDFDPLFRPGFYLSTPDIAGDHIIAMGHILKHSGIMPGDRVLEYGAGFGQIALALARLGAIVDTVDVDKGFCDAITKQASWYNAPLTSFQGMFGYNPRPGERYKLILFYESFHHCREFIRLIEMLKDIVAADGKIILAGEPIVAGNSPAMPHPWGINLDTEAASVIRIRGWYELVFQENFLLRSFVRAGFVFRKYPGLLSIYANLFEFTLRPKKISLSDSALIPDDETTWHNAQPTGRFTTACSQLTLDITGGWNTLRIHVVNYHPKEITARFNLGAHKTKVTFLPHETTDIDIPRQTEADRLDIFCQTILPTSYGQPDNRDLGIFVEHFEYID